MDHHHHVHFHFHSDPGQGETLAAIREVKELAMNLNDTLNELTADDAELAADVNALVSIINDIPNRTQAAVAGALTDAGLSDEHVRAALNAVDSTVKDAIAAARAVLPPTSPPAVNAAGTDTVGAGATDSLSGGQGNDAVTNGNGAGTSDTGLGNDTAGATSSNTDTLSGGQASDTVSGGGSDPAATNATSAQTDPTSGVVIPPPSASSPT